LRRIIYSTECYTQFGGFFNANLVKMGANVQNQSVHANADCVSSGYTGDLRSRLRQERKGNIEKDELVSLKKLAAELLAYDEKTIARVAASGVLLEVNCDEKAVP